MLLLVIILATLCSIRRMQRRNDQQTNSLGRQESQRDNSEMTAVSIVFALKNASLFVLIELV